MRPLKTTCCLVLFILLNVQQVSSCSMFKITLNGKTMVGNNEDSWRLTSKIWFEKGKDGTLGSMYLGYNDNFPQGGLNEAGIAFDGFSVYSRQLKSSPRLKKLQDPTGFIKEIMQHSRSVDDVKKIAEKYERGIFNNAMLLFVEPSGRYLVMEADTIMIGNDSKYVLSNFCPSITKDVSTVPIARYQRGRKLLAYPSADASLDFVKLVMDTMHECREKLGDGTLYTSIYDLEKKEIYLYFYHDYKNLVRYNLANELSAGDHAIDLPTLFPVNKEYQELAGFQTPQTSVKMLVLFFLLAAVFTKSLLYFFTRETITVFRNVVNKTRASVFYGSPWLILSNLLMMAFLFVMYKNKNILYYEAPFKITPGFSVVNLSAFIPWVEVGIFVPMVMANFKILSQNRSKFSKFVFTTNTVATLVALGLFAYWKLYSIF